MAMRLMRALAAVGEDIADALARTPCAPAHLRQRDLTSLASFGRRLPPVVATGRVAHAGVARAAPADAAVGHASSRKSRGRRPAKADARTVLDDTFLADADVGASGLHLSVVDSFRRAGFARLSQVQALAAGPLLDRRSVVLAAETGSGKTLAYLLPIMSAVLADVERGWDAGVHGALVLCPNAALCEQVVAFADRLMGADGRPLLRAQRLAAASPPSGELPHLVAATPAGLVNATREFAAAYGWHWSREGIVARMRWVVLDEADLLLSGGFRRDCRRVLAALRAADRQKAAERAAAALGLPLERVLALPRGELQALRARDPLASADADAAAAEQQLQPRQRWTRQYAFVAATLPEEGERSVGADIKQICPEAVWLSGRRLHQALPHVRYGWALTDEASWAGELQAAAAAQPEGTTLVFAGSVAGAEAAARVLRGGGLRPLVYHREVPAEEREAALRAAAATEGGLVLVCTDAAARGLDLPRVGHVVQADFAPTAVDFLHRVGRTGRAGGGGCVTSLYTEGERPLAEAIRAALEAGQPVEGAFSRNRSFRKKLRKYGKYVPRGTRG